MAHVVNSRGLGPEFVRPVIATNGYMVNQERKRTVPVDFHIFFWGGEICFCVQMYGGNFYSINNKVFNDLDAPIYAYRPHGSWPP